jgi:hypothetical protein
VRWPFTSDGTGLSSQDGSTTHHSKPGFPSWIMGRKLARYCQSCEMKQYRWDIRDELAPSEIQPDTSVEKWRTTKGLLRYSGAYAVRSDENVAHH